MDNLDCIRARGTVLLGTTGDYFPVSVFNPLTGNFEGCDIELGKKIGNAIGVKVEFVKTSWPELEEDLLANKFDLAICGITITEARKQKFLMSKGYLKTGKTILCRREDEEKFTCLSDVNKSSVLIMYNPGGTNEKFVKEMCPLAKKIVHAENQKIPDLIAGGKADVMITETVEAEYYIKANKKLAAPLISMPFTSDEFGVLMNKENMELLEVVNSIIG